jgi:hypothetical protein
LFTTEWRLQRLHRKKWGRGMRRIGARIMGDSRAYEDEAVGTE